MSKRPPRSSRSDARTRKLTTVVSLLLAAGCGLPTGSTEAQFDGVTPEQVMTAFKEIVTQEGYHVTEEAAGAMSTEWRNDFAMTYQDGTRRRAEIEATAAPDGHGTVVSVQVPIERNDEMEHPLHPERADWTADGRSIDDEMLLIMRLQMKLGLLRPD
jgi:hypothetical protein